MSSTSTHEPDGGSLANVVALVDHSTGTAEEHSRLRTVRHDLGFAAA